MNFVTQMLEMLTSAYTREDLIHIPRGQPPKTNIGRLHSVLGWGFDIVKENAERVKLWDDLDQAQGKVLDRYGNNYGVIRGTASDSIYRIMIKVKIISMLSAGNLDTIINAAALLFNVAPEDVDIDEVFPAKIYLYIDEDKLDAEHKAVADSIAALMHRIKAAGVGMRIFYRTYHSASAPIYVGRVFCKYVKMTVQPYKGNSHFAAAVPMQCAAGSLVYVERTYLPKEVKT